MRGLESYNDDILVDDEYIHLISINDLFNEDKRYVITSTVDLQGATVEVSNGVILAFSQNGYITNGTLSLNGTEIQSSVKNKLFDNTLIITGTFHNSEVYPEWWGATGDGITDDSDAINTAIIYAGKSMVVLSADSYAANIDISERANGTFKKLWVKGDIIGSIRGVTDNSFIEVDGAVISSNDIAVDLCSTDSTNETGLYRFNAIINSGELGTGTGLSIGGYANVQVSTIKGFLYGINAGYSNGVNLTVGISDNVYDIAVLDGHCSHSMFVINDVESSIRDDSQWQKNFEHSSVLYWDGKRELSSNQFTFMDNNGYGIWQGHSFKHHFLYAPNITANAYGNTITSSFVGITNFFSDAKYIIDGTARWYGLDVNNTTGILLQDIDDNVGVYNVYHNVAYKTKQDYINPVTDRERSTNNGTMPYGVENNRIWFSKVVVTKEGDKTVRHLYPMDFSLFKIVDKLPNQLDNSYIYIVNGKCYHDKEELGLCN